MLVSIAFAFASLAYSTPNPQPRPEQENCTKWQGEVSGNDPSVKITATLCVRGDQVTGTLMWRSDRSGTNTRRLSGVRSGNTLVLRDVELSGTPNRGWRFCIIDRYELAGAGGDALSGTYHSKACRDDARIALSRVR